MVPPERLDDERGDLTADPMLRTLVYCSKATAGVDEAAVAQIVATAQIYNPRHGITGLLVFGNRLFFQWLEGPPDSVAALMTRISADPRHDTVVTLSQSDEVRERLFARWDMELVAAEDIREVLNDALGEVRDAANAHALRLLFNELDRPLSD